MDVACASVLKRYSQIAEPAQVSLVTAEAGFSGALVWKVESRSQTYALRAMRERVVQQTRLAGLHRLLRHIQSQGADFIAIPIPDDAGLTFHVEQGFVWQLERWLPGAADYWISPSPERLQAALLALARWHRAAERFQPTEREQSWFVIHTATSPGLAERRDLIRQHDRSRLDQLRQGLRGLHDWPAFQTWGARILNLYERASPAISRDLDLGNSIVVPLQPCLRDIWHDHVLYQGEVLSGLIDAHACRSDSVATDVARLLGSLVGSDQTAWEQGLEAYERIRPLSVPERGLLEVFDRSSILLSGMTWLNWVCLQGRGFTERERVENRLHRILARLENLAQSC